MSTRVHKNFNRKFVKYLRKHGVDIQPSKGHAKLVHNDRVVGSMSTTAGGEVVYRSSIKQLIHRGCLPQEAHKERFS